MVTEFMVNDGVPDPESGRDVIGFGDPAPNHNGGMVQFGEILDLLAQSLRLADAEDVLASLPLGMDTVLSLWTACGGSEIVCNDDAVGSPCGGLDTGNLRDSYISQPLTAGQSVRIRVSKFNTVTSDAGNPVNKPIHVVVVC